MQQLWKKITLKVSLVWIKTNCWAATSLWLLYAEFIDISIGIDELLKDICLCFYSDRTQVGGVERPQRAASCTAPCLWVCAPRAAFVCAAGRMKVVVAQQWCSSGARRDSATNRLSLSLGIISPTLARNGKDWMRFLAQSHRVNVPRNATENSWLWRIYSCLKAGLLE